MNRATLSEPSNISPKRWGIDVTSVGLGEGHGQEGGTPRLDVLRTAQQAADRLPTDADEREVAQAIVKAMTKHGVHVKSWEVYSLTAEELAMVDDEQAAADE